MNIETLQKARIEAMKNGDTFRKQVISNMINQVQSEVYTPKGKIKMIDEVVDAGLIKYQKIIQEMLDTWPDTYIDKKQEYMAEMEIVKEFAPQLLADEGEIKETILSMIGDIELTKANKGRIMKIIMPSFRGKADMRAVNSVISQILN